ncbi:probable multidrug resistance-associated protein lethal(2)03659 [Neocloeon triangulifer]|uniref:probable multidrug resistance-associated protein lethal(2)03659 n=1 Tax=Neocloeon triangulifer TaxID=2078957 RepID=UPI00286F3AA3|nr:probable multidrug resistance-associated protein lethal(2)03659 [Neocloeon triangulifer]
MDAGKKFENPHPRAKANCLSALTFWWTTRMFFKGYKDDLEVEDLYDPLNEHKSDRLGDILERNWKKEQEKCSKKGTPSFFKAMWATFGLKFMAYGIVLLLIEIGVKVAQPLLLGQLIRYFTPMSGIEKDEAYWYAAGVILCSGISIVTLHPYMLGIMHIGMQMRVAACSLIYRKALRLSHQAMGQTTAGQVVNLLSNDVNRFDVVPIFMHYLWVGPLQTAVVSYLMYSKMGWSALMGVATLLLTIPLQGWLGKKTSTLRMRTAVKTDERVRLMNEIISGIQVIKMYTWEIPFAKLVDLARRLEIKQIRIASYIKGVYLSFIMFTTRVTVYVTVVAYVLNGQEITAEKVFVISSYYNIIRQTMTIFFPQGISQFAEGSVSIKRLENFLLLNEISEDAQSRHSASTDSSGEKGPIVSLQNATAKWNDEIADPTLNNVNVTMKSGQLLAVIGPVGSGKTSLIHAILQELPLTSGSLSVSGTVSYAAQEPWLFAGSVRQNIIFGQAWDPKRYKTVVRVCALEKDFSQLPYGDETVVGERGVSLSGGQRARVSLARAVYKEADIYLLDDPLSAVDTHVGRHLFDDCITGFLKSKAVLLITHQLQYLTHADQILILNNGVVEAQGTYQQLQESGLDFAQLLAEAEDELEDDIIDDDDEDEAVSGLRRRRRGSSESSAKSALEGVVRQISMQSVKASQELQQKKPKAQQEVAEMKSKGSVAGFVYKEYFKAGGNACLIFTMFLMFALAQIAASGADYWLTFWTNWEEVQNNSTKALNESSSSSGFYTIDYTTLDWMNTNLGVYIYSAVIFLTLSLSLFRSYLFFNVCMQASVNLHDSMFSSITRATMYFFNTNPSGRILNRFSKDMGSIDEMLPAAMIDALQIGMTLVGIIIVVAIVNVWFLLPTLVIGIIFYYLRIIYLSTSRSVKRLEGTTRSPVFSHLNASIQGLTTIRAFGAQQILESQFDHHQDLHSSAWYLFISTSRAFGYWLDVICFIYIAIVTLSFLVLGSENYGGDVGLAITQALGLTGMFQWGMRQSAEMENQMTSVERVLEFSNLESEPPLETKEEAKPEKGWPNRGAVEFDKLSLKYKEDDPPVLKEISFKINPEEKIGIVGRTGAGKSSLISALFRLAKCSGRILIDGVDTTTLGLHQLRANISIIPQEPVLFSGNMRKNLDPFDEFPDEVLWTALEEVEMKEAVAELPGGLGAKMSEGGSNFSVGQRQLVCLARAIVRNNKILVMDEATANVDPKTDTLIQSTIRRKFEHCTVLTIAHRLHTIMDSDRVLVMDAGRVAEFAPPSQLLDDPHSVLARMANQTGASNALNLRQKANQQPVQR